ncbi:MAG: TIGR04552 family protein [Deltaproteobacteria bacterium]|nr:TIGR04552 family protein [Deltaproteobacteria bacterium]
MGSWAARTDRDWRLSWRAYAQCHRFARHRGHFSRHDPARTVSLAVSVPELRSFTDFTLADLEGIRVLLRGGSVVDWHRFNFADESEAEAFVRAQEIDPDDESDVARVTQVKEAAIDYLRRHFDFPVPKPVAKKDLVGLLMLASSKGHRQICACAILKVMHIIHHLEARELLFVLPTADEEVCQWVEQKVYRVMAAALANDFPILEFIGGRKNRDSLYTKLLSKPDVSASQIYDKVRFRIVTRSSRDIFPVLNYVQRSIVPFNFVIPGQSTNTLARFHEYCRSEPALTKLVPQLQLPLDLEDGLSSIDNRFTAPSYRIVHFVADVPVRVPDKVLAAAPPAAAALGHTIFVQTHTIFVQTEFQVLDRATDESNEAGDASHQAYKERQKLAVMHRLKVGRFSK